MEQNISKLVSGEIKLLLAALGGTLLLILGFAFWQGRGITGEPENAEVFEVTGLAAEPVSYDLGEVPISGGLVSREYAVKNTTAKTLKLRKIATSCMCTTAQVVVGDKTTRFFGMEMGMDKNPPVNLEIGAGQTAKVVTQFDPAAHGPQGVGPFERIIWLTFADPAGTKELRFNGTVVSQ